MGIAWEAVGTSDTGRVRPGNEDAFLVDAPRGIFLVADGMGGHAAGEIASRLATEAAGETLARAVDGAGSGEALTAALQEAFSLAHERIARCCADQPRTHGMGTTLTVCVLTPEGSCWIGHVGDSRAYLLRNGHLEQLTVDHTWVQREVDAGRLSPDAVRRHPLAHILTRVLIADVREEPDLLAPAIQPADLLLLASDGLTGMLEDAEIARILTQPHPLRKLTATLVREANARGGVDNITAVLVRILPGAPTPPTG